MNLLLLPQYNTVYIVIRLAKSRNKLSPIVGRKIAEVVWNDMRIKDVRDALQLAKIVTSVEEVEETARTMIKYGNNKNGNNRLFV